ncbi:uncharacterized protein [Antennarius striatus]|uniref:uncharacterized protein isoform X2 n=1 Tax=Antennarius striatus TaxID=241820 RepID=UPI0035B4C90B
MWNGKMAARWRLEDWKLKAGSSVFAPDSVPAESVLSRCGEEDTQSHMDQSILAIFEDSGLASEDKCGVEEDSVTLLSALTDMLDSVGVEDGALSPFDTLPDAKPLTHPESRNNSVEPSLAERLRPRIKSPNAKFTIKMDGVKEYGRLSSRPHKKMLFQSRNKKTEAEVEVFTSTSLANLVKIMHPYCLRLRVEEEGDKPSKNPTFFSQEEVWKYERPNEELDEEINVVSDDEGTVKASKKVDRADVESDNGKLLKSVLLSGKSSRSPSIEKKRVSFGSVQVASYDASVEWGSSEKNLTSGPTGEAVSVPPNTKKAPADSLGLSSETNGNRAEVLPPKGETKTKALSLQQYRQLCQNRPPLVEKQGNYTTKWPSVSEPLKGLAPIFCLQGERPNICESKSTHLYSDGWRNGADQPHRSKTSGSEINCVSALPGPHPSKTRTSAPPGSNEFMHKIKESKITSLDNQLVGIAANLPKKPKLLSSDPPNPVLVPLSVSETSAHTEHLASVSKVKLPNGYSDFDDTRHFQEIQNRSQQSTSFWPEPKVLRVNQDSKTSFQDRQPHKNILIPTKETKPEENTPRSPCWLEAPTPVKKERQPTALFDCITADTGIEAPDLTSLLEQFEETQAKNNRLDPHAETLESSSSPKTLSHSLISDCIDIPEPFGSEIVIKTQDVMLARHKNPPSKSIQLIDPRPLRSRKTHLDLSEFPAALTALHMFSSILSDHDYCGRVDGPPTNTAHQSRAAKLKDTNGSSDDLEETADATTSKQEIPTDECNTTVISAVHNSAKSDIRGLSEERSTPSTGGVLPPSESTSSSHCHTPPPSSLVRGRERSRYRRRAPSSDSSSSSSSPSSSPSRSPKRQKWSYSRSWSRSRSRSRSPSPARGLHGRRWKEVYRRGSRWLRSEREVRIRKLKAIEERRVVYVGRICGSMTHNDLRERFSQFGEVECVSLHFREIGHHYGFVTFSNMKDAFAAISKGSKLRRPDELPFDLCFGGRRQFCYSDYTDLDATRDADPSPAKSKFEELDFDQLLKQAQRGLKR